MPPLEQPSCKVLYDFQPENDGELGFHEGDVFTLINQINEKWYQGMLDGQLGFFLLSYLDVLVPLPSDSLVPPPLPSIHIGWHPLPSLLLSMGSCCQGSVQACRCRPGP
ncbi:endophilin-A2-like [Pongo pygmaeus]|uniref:endophilin-A2-like n=1 Tax=Pongo pygmaeus TaxID=9600 RepID=UPI00300C595F